jgi:TrmH family RNA methyltransferase
MTERITSRSNPLVKHIRELARSAEARRASGCYVAEGNKLLREALAHNADMQTVVYREPAADDALGLPPHVRVVTLPADIFDSLTTTPSPPGVLFVCGVPALTLPETLPPGRYIVLDRLQDPGNIGAILRSAGAFGGCVILCGGCADPFSPKAARAAMGAVFHVPLYRGSEEEIHRALGGIPLYAADPDPAACTITGVDLNPSAVVIGQEGSGISDSWRARCRRVCIPMNGCESLNAAIAAAVILWEGYRR